ncbi:hypothetical protein GQ600_16151 [Phytophthora cactorum]|nr:hypothetical protein GQ600_16151 [Phytophthora cactorum]
MDAECIFAFMGNGKWPDGYIRSVKATETEKERSQVLGGGVEDRADTRAKLNALNGPLAALRVEQPQHDGISFATLILMCGVVYRSDLVRYRTNSQRLLHFVL